ncbi:hypothetical protein KFL_010690010, partial [Klebsormidium nitens]
GQVSATGLSVTGVASQGDGLTYSVTVVSDLRADVTERTVWVQEGAVQDVARNPNQASEVLKISFGTSSRAVAAAALGARIVSSGLATTTGISIAALLPTVLLQVGDLLGAWAGGLPSASPGASSPRFAARGNLLGIVGTVQTFALFRKLAIRQSAVFQEVTGSLAPMGLESRSKPSLEVDSTAASALAPTASVTGVRRRLLQNGTGTGISDPDSILTEGWHSSGLIFGRALIVLSATSVVRTAAAYVWKRVSKQSLPDLLLFPRAELQAGAFCFYPVSVACASLLQGHSTTHAFVGALLLLFIPCSAIVVVLGFLATHVILGSEAHFEPSGDPFKTLTWRGRAAAACFGAPCEGRWTDAHPAFKRPAGRFGLLFESFRPPSCTGVGTLSGRETANGEDDINGRPQLGTVSERSTGEMGRLELSESCPGRTGRPGLSAHGDERSQESDPVLLGAGVGRRVADGARALLRMLRTCHVGAVLTKRLVFAALLAAREPHLAGSNPGLGQVGLLLTTSSIFLSWLVIAKPYVSQALQGVELVTGILEVLTLSLALLSGRAERKAFRTGTANGTAGTGSLTEGERRLSAGMLALQILAVGVQTGYQWWAAFVGLKAHRQMWKERREQQTEKETQVGRFSQTFRNGDERSASKRGVAKGRRDLRSVLGLRGRRGAGRKEGSDEASSEEAPTRPETVAKSGPVPRVTHARRRNQRQSERLSNLRNENDFESNWGCGASDVDPSLTQWLQEDVESKTGILSGSERVKRNRESPSVRQFVRGDAELGASGGQSRKLRTVEDREKGARAERVERKGRGWEGGTERKQGRTERKVDRRPSVRATNLFASSGGEGKVNLRMGPQQSDRPARSRQMIEPDDEGTSVSPHSGGQEIVAKPHFEEITEASARASEVKRKSARAARLGRLKSRRKVTATATMTYFVVSESDESELSDGEDRTAGVNVRLEVRRSMVASFTFKTEPESVDKDWYQRRVG